MIHPIELTSWHGLWKPVIYYTVLWAMVWLCVYGALWLAERIG